jgi:MoxR-like ATPase
MTTAKKHLAVATGSDLEIAANTARIIESQLNTALLERSDIVRAMFNSFLAGEHIALLGDPGVGKSFMADLFAHFMAGGSWFDIQMSPSTVIDELFGQVMLSEYKKDNLRRKFSHFAPAKKIWFLDEIFKCNSQTLNGILRAINERKILNGELKVEIPLEMVMAASNEYPEKGLEALWDRFVTRFWVEDLQDDCSMEQLWGMDNGIIPKPLLDATISEEQIAILRKAVEDFQLSKNEISILGAIRIAVREAGFKVSTRVWRKAPKLIKANAVMEGRTHLVPSDYLVLADMLWKRHTDRPALFTVIGNAADPYGSRATAILDGIRAAMTEIPNFSLLKSGALTKPEFINKLAAVQSMLSSENGKIADLEDTASGNPSIEQAREKWIAAKEVCDKAMNEAVMHRS